MAFKLNPVFLACQNFFFVFIGIFGFLILFIYFIVSLPSYLYRYLVAKVFAPCFLGRNDVKMVTKFCDAIAVEILHHNHSPRCNTLINMIVDGHVTYDKLYQDIQEKWLEVKDKNGNLQFPELQRKLIGWMGYIFWKEDLQFDTKNHLILHKLDENGSEQDSEKYIVDMCEGLINHRWDKTRSPWQMHLVQNYKNPEIKSENGGKLTMMTFCISHCLADGYALLHLLLERLGGYDMDSAVIAQSASLKRKSGCFKKTLNSLIFPYKLLHEIGRCLCMMITIKKTNFHITDTEKSWTQLYARGSLIPISKLKLIKKTFNSSFVALLYSVSASAFAKTLENIHKNGNKNGRDFPKDFEIAFPIPRANHPKKLRIHVLGGLVVVSANPNMDPIERLQDNENNIQFVKNSALPFLSGVITDIVFPQPPKVARFMVKNRFLATGVTSFPGPGVPINWHEDKKLVGCDFAAGVMPGYAGTAFMMLSYADKIRFCATAERAVLSREELNQMLTYVSEEVDILYELALTAAGGDSEKSGLIDSFEIENEKR